MKLCLIVSHSEASLLDLILSITNYSPRLMEAITEPEINTTLPLKIPSPKVHLVNSEHRCHLHFAKKRKIVNVKSYEEERYGTTRKSNFQCRFKPRSLRTFDVTTSAATEAGAGETSF